MNQTTKTNDQSQLVLVVGGAKGIGLATAKTLRAQGIDVIAADNNAVALQAVQDDHDIKAVLMDMTDGQSVKAALKEMPPLH